MSQVNYINAAEAVTNIKSGQRVFIHGSAATPIHIIHALQNRYQELKDVELVSITSFGDVDFNDCAQKASYITPVPGGVGPMTRAMLMKNTLLAYKTYQP